MENLKGIKGIIFDYGGTIDSHGDHWSEVIWDGYRENNVPVTKEQFRECYVFAERELARTRHILPGHNFHAHRAWQPFQQQPFAGNLRHRKRGTSNSPVLLRQGTPVGRGCPADAGAII